MKKKTAITGLLKLVAIIVFIPLSIASAQSFFIQLHGLWTNYDRAFNLPQQYFVAGILVYAALHFLLHKPITTYVFAHEMSHAVWTWLFLGRVENINVAKEGGNVTVSKSNFLITLAPYFFPFYTVLLVLVYFLAKLLWLGIADYYLAFIFLLGFTLCFHLLFTLHTLRTEQSDIKTTGIIFSALLIFLLNLQVITALLNLVFPSRISWLEFNIFIRNGAISLCETTYNFASHLIQR